MPPLGYIELLKPSADDPPRLTILKSKYNRIAIKLNGFYKLLSEEEINKAITELKYYESQIDMYE